MTWYSRVKKPRMTWYSRVKRPRMTWYSSSGEIRGYARGSNNVAHTLKRLRQREQQRCSDPQEVTPEGTTTLLRPSRGYARGNNNVAQTLKRLRQREQQRCSDPQSTLTRLMLAIRVSRDLFLCYRASRTLHPPTCVSTVEASVRAVSGAVEASVLAELSRPQCLRNCRGLSACGTVEASVLAELSRPQCLRKRVPKPSIWSLTPPSRSMCQMVAWIEAATGRPVTASTSSKNPGAHTRKPPQQIRKPSASGTSTSFTHSLMYSGSTC